MSQCVSERVEVVVDIYESVDAVRGRIPEGEASNTGAGRRLQTPLAGCDNMDRRYRLTSACLLLLCVLLLITVSLLIIKNSNLQDSYNTSERERDGLFQRLANWKRDLNKPGWKYFNNSIYYVSNEKRNWNESRQDCKERGADLVIINSQEEQDFIKDLRRGDSVWIGLMNSEEDGKWKWVDGSEITVGYFPLCQPHCGISDPCVGTVESWNVHHCTTESFWICEKKIE